MEQPVTVTVQVESIEVVQARTGESAKPPHKEYSLSLSCNGGRFASACRAEHVAKAIERAVAKAIKTA